MVKESWGTKRTCHACGTTFYDLNKRPIICVKCGATVDTHFAPKTKRNTKKDHPQEQRPLPLDVDGLETLPDDLDVELEGDEIIADDLDHDAEEIPEVIEPAHKLDDH